ncbi:60S ribosomal protein L6 [Blastocladiella emersonii ATCC 22665]|nr:60S ribosomal protein L6 [Blastocladiella emersonii ATCC 22665]
MAFSNEFIAPGVTKYSAAKVYKLKGAYKVKAAPKHAKKAAPAAPKAAKFYPAEDAAKPKKSRKAAPKTAKLRASITPGTVLILLAGRFRGRRVVFLKQLASGLLLVTGPHKINGIPIRRVSQAYVIATSTKVDVSNVDVTKFDDAYFKKAAAPKAAKSAEAFFADPKSALSALPASRVADQKAVDKALLATVAKIPNLAKYLAGTFSLTNGQIPHLLKF